MTLNITNPVPLQVDGKDLPITETFTYMGSTVRNDGGAGNDIMNRLNKARNVFRTLNIVWKSSQYSKPTKYSCTSVAYYLLCYMDQNAGGLQKTTRTNCHFFHTKSLRRILRIFWPNTISNEDLLRQCNQESIKIQSLEQH